LMSPSASIAATRGRLVTGRRRLSEEPAAPQRWYVVSSIMFPSGSGR
jgi:hypothetical protein